MRAPASILDKPLIGLRLDAIRLRRGRVEPPTHLPNGVCQVTNLRGVFGSVRAGETVRLHATRRRLDVLERTAS